MKKSVILSISILLGYAIFGGSVCRGQSTVSSILRTGHTKKEKIAIMVICADTGKVLYSQQADAPMIPASNMKLIVSAAALHYLGADYIYRTSVGMLGDNLVVIGGGDPLLGDPERAGPPPEWIFEQIAEDLLRSGRKRVENILLDATFFDNNRVHPQWPKDQLNRRYACEISGLNFYCNCLHLTARRTGRGSVLEITPSTGYVNLKNQLKLISKGSSAAGAYRTNRPNCLVVKGTLNKSTGFDVAIEDPAGFFGTLLYETLTKQGVEVRGKLIQKYIKSDPGIRVFRTFETPIHEALGRCNKDSLGLAAEALVKTISAERTEGQINGEWPHGLHLIGRYLQSLGISPEEFHLADGSGLSRDNRLSPRAIVTVLRDMTGRSFGSLYELSLSQGGLDGTTARYFQDSPYRGNIAGKTGYINGVRTFSGICHTPRGDLIFSILTEGGDGKTRQKINELTKAVFDGRW